jgi:tetratricopeptide (TPR) repeat protein
MAAYDAFLSYNHAKDKPIAAALQSAVQRLGKPWYRRRALRVFRDDTSLSATPSLWPSIEQALRQSRFLILLASPEAATSPWVNKEVAYWLEHKSPDTLLIGVTDGDLSWDSSIGDFAQRDDVPLPPVLCGRFPSEPKWVDFRTYRDGANPRDGKFADLAATFAASIHGIPKEDLLSQEVQQQRRALMLAWSAAALLFLLTGAAAWQWSAAIKSEQRAERNFGVAKDTVDRVIFDLAQGLHNVEGIRADTVRQILGRAEIAIGQLASRTESDPQVRNSQAVMLGLFSDTYLRLGKPQLAADNARQSTEIMRELSGTDPSNKLWRRNLSSSLERLGDVLVAQGDLKGALAVHREQLDIARELVVKEPSNGGRRQELSASLGRVGNVLKGQGDLKGALAVHHESLDIMRELSARDARNIAWRSGLAISLGNIGDVLVAQGDLKGVLAVYRESLDIMRELSAKDPADASWRRYLSANLGKIGDVLKGQGDLKGAFAVYLESLDIMRELSAKDPADTILQLDLVSSIVRLRLLGDDPIGRLSEALPILSRLKSQGRLPPAQQGLIDIIKAELAELVEQLQGDYFGTNTVNEWPGEAQIALTFQLSGNDVAATYQTSSGARGRGTGTIAGNVIKTMSLQSEGVGCPGSFTAEFVFSGDSVSWTYTGQDCSGPQHGHGSAKKTRSEGAALTLGAVQATDTLESVPSINAAEWSAPRRVDR